MNDASGRQDTLPNGTQLPSSNQVFTSTDHSDEIDLLEYLGALLAYKWLIVAITLFGLLLGVTYALLATPVYQANALIQVEDAQSSALAGLEDVAGLLESDAAIEAELQLLRSRMVLRPALEQLGENIIAQPRYFPRIGRAIARRFRGAREGVAKPWFAQGQYAWGGEQIVVELLEVPAPLLGETLRLVAGKQGHYTLLGKNDKTLLSGEVGKVAEATLSDYAYLAGDDPQGGAASIKLFVTRLKAREGGHFNVMRLSPMTAVESVLANLSVSEKGKKSGMLSVSYRGADKASITGLLNKIADVYVAQNVARNSAEAELSLSFLEKQLPPLKQRVDAAENAYNLYRTQHSSIDLGIETQAVLAGLVQVEEGLLDLQQQRDELRNRFKPAHPVIKALDEKINLLAAHGKGLEAQAERLPETQRDILRLARDVEVNTVLYTKLLNIAQELRVVKAGTVGNVRVIDYALVPEHPIKPKKSLIAALALMLSFFFAVALALVLNALRGGINDPDLLERQLGLPVYASIIHSKAQILMAKRSLKKGIGIGVLCAEQVNDLAVESFRSLRTTLHFTLKQASNNIIMVAGASPKVGKSFTSVNLAAVMASSGQKILLIDADLRRGYMHRYFGEERGEGLAEFIATATTGEEFNANSYVRSSSISGLDFITTGTLPANPAELLLHESFKQLLDALAAVYDHIIIDSPPVLAVTDASIIGKNAGTTLLVVKANFHTLRELEQTNKQLQQAGVVVKGIVFNDVDVNSGRYSYGGKYVYQYDYQS